MKQTIEKKIAEIEKTIKRLPNGNSTPLLKRIVAALKRELEVAK